MPIKIGAGGIQQDAFLVAAEIPYPSDPWVSPTLGIGWTQSSDTPLTYRRLSSHLNLVFIVGSAKITTASTYFGAIFTLPPGATPSNNRYIVATLVKDGNLSVTPIRLALDGRLLVFLTASSSAQEIWLDCIIHL